MSRFDIEVLRMLRVFGPCSNAEIARKMQQPLHRTYAALYRLCNTNMAKHPKLQVWEITKRGIRVFNDQPNKVLAIVKEVA